MKKKREKRDRKSQHPVLSKRPLETFIKDTASSETHSFTVARCMCVCLSLIVWANFCSTLLL